MSTSVVSAGIRAAERAFTITLRAYAPDGMTQDADGSDIPDFADKGTCSGKVQGSTSRGRDTQTRYLNIGSVARPVLEAALHLPLDEFVDEVDGLLIAAGEQRGLGWEFVVESVAGMADPALLGRRYLVVEVPAKSFATARRLSVIEVD